MRSPSLWLIATAIIFSTRPAAAAPMPDDAIQHLATGTVSRLEWGLDKLRRTLVETLAIDPLSLEPSSPPYFVNVSFELKEKRIEIEIGRSFPSVERQRARQLCDDYIARVRGLFGVDRSGEPAVNGVSSLTEDMFHPLDAATPPDSEFAQAVDRSVVLRALVASPMNGVYSICSARLTHSPIRHTD